MGRVRKGWYEREQVSKVTLDWVKVNCKITEREMELLDIINKRKLVRRDMLEVISPSYRYLGDNRTIIINRSIKKMFMNMCLDKVHEPRGIMGHGTPAIVSLDKAGSMLLGIPHKSRINQTKKLINGEIYVSRQLPLNYRHINGVNQLEVETILFCENSDNEIVGWHHEKPIELHYGQERVSLIVDVAMEIKSNREPYKTLYAFIEFDTGAESLRYKEPPIIKDKIIKYKKYKLSRLWESEYPQFPIVLLVTEDEKRIGFFNRKCKENGLLGLGVYHINYSKFLKRMTEI